MAATVVSAPLAAVAAAEEQEPAMAPEPVMATTAARANLRPDRDQDMNRYLAIGYAAASYALFLVTFVYLVGFIGDFGVPHTVSHGITAPPVQAVLINTALLGVFAVQHSVMARPAFKQWWTRLVPQAIERSTYVLLSSAVLILLFWQWRSMPTPVWDITSVAGRFVVWSLFWLGWAIALTATFLINHFDLFGLRQVYLAWHGKPYTDIGFSVRLLYRVVRHPLLLGFVIAFWAAPTMTTGHLLFAVVTTGHMLLAIQLEERDLLAALGDRYRDYRQEVPMLVPRPRRWSTTPVVTDNSQKV
jgi:protein-S-isoprenylcysteine O-methyltransferase Ste14